MFGATQPDSPPMSSLPHSTLEQWAILRAVVERGGFSPAAEVLHRSQSSVSYAVGRLQEALGVQLLEPQGRRAVLTPAGTALLAEVIPLIDELARLETRSRAIAGGEAVRVRLLVDTVFPRQRLFAALARFAAQHPHVEVSLREIVRQSLAEIPNEAFDLAVLIAEPGATLAARIAEVPLVAVAAADHPLARAARVPGRILLARHARVEIRGMEASGMATDEGRIWRMNTVEAAIEAVRHGLCYGWLPRHLVAGDLEAGRLRILPLASGGTRVIPLGLLFGAPSPGPSVRALAALLSGATAPA